jgi:hypothetical protein
MRICSADTLASSVRADISTCWRQEWTVEVDFLVGTAQDISAEERLIILSQHGT